MVPQGGGTRLNFAKLAQGTYFEGRINSCIQTSREKSISEILKLIPCKIRSLDF